MRTFFSVLVGFFPLPLSLSLHAFPEAYNVADSHTYASEHQHNSYNGYVIHNASLSQQQKEQINWLIKRSCQANSFENKTNTRFHKS